MTKRWAHWDATIFHMNSTSTAIRKEIAKQKKKTVRNISFCSGWNWLWLQNLSCALLCVCLWLTFHCKLNSSSFFVVRELCMDYWYLLSVVCVPVKVFEMHAKVEKSPRNATLPIKNVSLLHFVRKKALISHTVWCHQYDCDRRRSTKKLHKRWK